jgi:quinol monooxygenase YgiN
VVSACAVRVRGRSSDELSAGPSCDDPAAGVQFDEIDGGDMTVGLVAAHYPKPEHAAEMLERVRAAAEVLIGTPGCLEASCWRESNGAVVTIGKWDSEAALKAGFAAVATADVDFDYDDRESRPRDVYRIVSA